MKAKILVLLALFIQFFFLFILINYNKDVSELIEVGVERLEKSYPSEAPTYSKSAEGYSILKTSGDFLITARGDYIFQTAVSFIVAAINIFLLLFFTFAKPYSMLLNHKFPENQLLIYPAQISYNYQ